MNFVSLTVIPPSNVKDLFYQTDLGHLDMLLTAFILKWPFSGAQKGAPMKGCVEGYPYIFSLESTVSISHQPLIKCSVSGVHIRALIETGSMKSFISAHIFKKISPRPVLEHNAPQCISITGQQMFVEGTTQLKLSFQGAPLSASYQCQFIASSSLTDSLECVLGWEFLTDC